MVDKQKVSEVIEQRIRPALQSHGGDVQLVEVTDDGVVKVILEGACKGCPMAELTIRQGVQERLRSEVPGVKEVVSVAPGEATA